jgi:hypothetical protein
VLHSLFLFYFRSKLQQRISPRRTKFEFGPNLVRISTLTGVALSLATSSWRGSSVWSSRNRPFRTRYLVPALPALRCPTCPACPGTCIPYQVPCACAALHALPAPALVFRTRYLVPALFCLPCLLWHLAVTRGRAVTRPNAHCAHHVTRSPALANCLTRVTHKRAARTHVALRSGVCQLAPWANPFFPLSSRHAHFAFHTHTPERNVLDGRNTFHSARATHTLCCTPSRTHPHSRTQCARWARPFTNSPTLPATKR